MRARLASWRIRFCRLDHHPAQAGRPPHRGRTRPLSRSALRIAPSWRRRLACSPDKGAQGADGGVGRELDLGQALAGVWRRRWPRQPGGRDAARVQEGYAVQVLKVATDPPVFAIALMASPANSFIISAPLSSPTSSDTPCSPTTASGTWVRSPNTSSHASSTVVPPATGSTRARRARLAPGGGSRRTVSGSAGRWKTRRTSGFGASLFSRLFSLANVHLFQRNFREEMLDPSAIAELRSRQLGHILPEGETLPPALEEVFADFSAALKEVWRPNHQLAVLIRKQRMELGLGGGGLRHRKHSPTWGGNRRQGGDGSSPTAAELAEEEEYEQEYEFGVAERSDRGPVVGVHLSGLKARLDLAQFGLAASSRAGNLSAAFEGASDAVRRLSHASIAAPSYSRSRPTIFPPTARPTLVALTSNASLFSDFAADQAALPFDVLRTSSPPYEDLRRWNDVLRLELTEDIAPPKGDAGTLMKEFNQNVWNKDLPRALQIYLARYFVRDLTTLSQFADAFVVSGMSLFSLPFSPLPCQRRGLSRSHSPFPSLRRRLPHGSPRPPPRGRRRHHRPARLPRWLVRRPRAQYRRILDAHEQDRSSV
ncbi:SPOSA6832_01040, partial [Sporobolomyces salmonicolor]